MRWRTRAQLAAPVIALGLLGSALLGGCGIVPTACPAIGWFNNLVVSVDGAITPVNEVRVCVTEGCISSADLQETAMPSALSISDLAGASFRAKDGQNWKFSFSMRSPGKLTVRVLGADGSELRSVEAAPEWVRVGGTEQCGGPSEATVKVS